MTRTRSNSGFTLMEVVVATTLMALVMSTLFMGLRLAANAWRKGEAKLEEHARTLAGLELVEREVAAAVPRTISIRQKDQTVRLLMFRGSATEARFLARRSWQGDVAHPLFMVQLSVAKDNRDERLQRLTVSEQAPMDSAEMAAAAENNAFAPLTRNSQTKAREEIVGDAADKIELAYLRPATANRAQAWVDAWDPRENDELPRAVRITFIRAGRSDTTTLLVPTWRERPEGF
jgi:prepilin-type N-terminal cleavage/methylation domain-containing protein